MTREYDDNSQPGRPRILAVFVAYNSNAFLEQAIKSTLVSGARFEISTVIVDNGRIRVPPALADELSCKLLPMSRNLGYSKAVGAGIDLGGESDYLVIANPDIKVGPAALDHLIERLEAEPELGAVGPILQHWDGPDFEERRSRCPNGRKCIPLYQFVLHTVLKTSRPENRFTRNYYNETQCQPTNDVDWLSGSFLAVRRKAFDQAGGLDARFHMYFEDVAFGVRLREFGWRNELCDAAAVSHLRGASMSQEARWRKLTWHISSASKFYLRYYRRHRRLREHGLTTSPGRTVA